jgi:cell division protein FtsB
MDWLRLRRRAAEATFVVEYPTDARRAMDDPRATELDPDLERKRKLRRGARAFILYTVFVAGVVAALFGDGGLTDLLRLQRDLRSARAELSAQQRKVDLLRRDILSLERDPAASERIAREELGLALPGEYLFLLPEESEPEAAGEAGEPSGR